MQSPSKIAHASTSTTTPAVYELQGWADLPESLLHSIIPLLCSILEVLAFAGTCRSWRAAFSSYPSKLTLHTLLPPLLVQPHITVHAPNLPSRSDDGRKLGTYQVLDLANMESTLRCQVPEETFEKLRFAGSSYGQLICGRGRNCLVVDVFTGAEVLSPELPFTRNSHFYCGMLTAPLASPNSHLLVCAQEEQGSECFLFDWLIGSGGSWSKLQLDGTAILQIVEFNGQFIAMDAQHRLYTLSLAPQLGLQEIATEWLEDMDGCPITQPWLVVCKGKLLFVDYYLRLAPSRAPVNYIAYLLDMSTEPAAWFQVGTLVNDALFIGGDGRSPAFCCMNPGRWGGRSNCLYYAHYKQPWVLHGLGVDADAIWDDSTDPDFEYNRVLRVKPQPFWVYPSMLN